MDTMISPNATPPAYRLHQTTATQAQALRASARPRGTGLSIGLRLARVAAALVMFAAFALSHQQVRAATVVGTATIQSNADSNAAGTAEAFLATASASGTVTQLVVYLDATNAASRVAVGLFSDDQGHPALLLTQATISAPVKGAWNTVAVPAAQVSAGQRYWLTILAPTGAGIVKFRDVLEGGHSETSVVTNLATLPPSWNSGTSYPDGAVSFYAVSAATTTPILATSPAALSFSATAGGAAPAAASVNVTNAGGGTLSYTASTSTNWLTSNPGSGTAPATVSIGAATGALVAGTYTGQVTIAASGAVGSPATIPVTLTVKPATPTLVVTPSSLAFAATVGTANPAAATLAVANAGGGTLPFTVTANANWLTATPTSATAPANESIQPVITGLAVGTYSGQVTITAAGATGSPTLVPVTLTVSAPVGTASDWPMVGQNPSRTSFASNDSVIDKTNVSGMALTWAAVLDGKVSAQPLFLSRVSIAGATHDVVLAATNQNSLYAFDADAGTSLWTVNFGANLGGSDYAVPGGLGVRSAPAVDRATGRIFVVSDDGKLHTISLANGAVLAPALQVIDLPITNKVRGGVNLFGSELYFASGSDGGDTPPWRGRIFHFNVAATAPVLQSTFDVVPGIAGNNRGGGIWSYGGVSVDTVTGNVYASTGADYAGAYTPYAVRVLKLTPNLSLIGSYEPSHPTTFACDGSPCDVDFSASPTVFTPTGCPTMVAAGNKDGHLYVLRTNDFASTTPVYQAMTLNLASDPLANGGVGGIPAFWAAGNMLYVTDSGDGVAGVPAGVVALSISAAPACKLSVAWTVPLPKLGSAQSSPTVVGNVVLVGEGGSGEVHALDAATGAELWNSGTTVTGNTYAAPTVGAGKIFVGSWAGRAPSDIGVLRAFSIAGSGGTGGCTGSPPPVLVGTQVIGSTHDGNVLGMAEAFQATAAGCGGTANAINLYVDAASTAGTVVVGLYADNGGHPGMLLTQAALASPVAGAWNRVPVPAAALTAGSPYWLAVLGTTRGTVAFRTSAGCRSEVSASSALTTLPTTWASGASYTGCPLAAYAGP